MPEIKYYARVLGVEKDLQIDHNEFSEYKMWASSARKDKTHKFMTIIAGKATYYVPFKNIHYVFEK